MLYRVYHKNILVVNRSHLIRQVSKKLGASVKKVKDYLKNQGVNVSYALVYQVQGNMGVNQVFLEEKEQVRDKLNKQINKLKLVA